MNRKTLPHSFYAYFFLLVSFLLVNSPLHAQETTVQGTVTDAFNHEPLPGVNIVLLGTTIATHTDQQGNFSLKVPNNNAKLRFSYVGYEPQEVAATGATLSIALNPASNDLNEVVVVAYGTAKRSSFTGSVSSISQDKIANRQVSSISKALEGQAAGVQSVSSSGQPGTDAEIRIRGVGSINASSAPLYVVDGNPYSGDINAINPNDIKSISVLKDAASSALYGSRGANGVIIITTKEGLANNGTTINFNLTQGFSSRAVKDYETVNTDQYFELYWEALRNAALTNGLSADRAAQNATNNVVGELGINPYGLDFPQPIGLDGKLVAGAQPLWNDNWRDVLQRTGHRTQADLSFSGGNEKSNYYFSAGYLNDQGIAIESGFKRYNARLNVNTQAKKWLNAGLNVAVSSSTQQYPQSEDSNTLNIIYFTRAMPSFYPYYQRNPDGSFVEVNGERLWDYGSWRPSGAMSNDNLAGSMPLNKNDIRNENFSGRGYLEAVILPELKLKSTFSLDYINRNTHDYGNPIEGESAETGGFVDKSNTRRVSYTWNNIVTYEKTFNDHHINLLGGQEFYKYENSLIDGSRSHFALPGFYEPDAASQLDGFNGYKINYSLLSFLGRAEYDYKNRYFLSGSLRTDGSSRFAPETRWGTFWSVGASWKIAEENFLKDNSLINQLTLRASYGGQGNDKLQDQDGNPIYYAYQGLYSFSSNLGEAGVVTQRLPTPDLRWETNLNFNVGLDIAILDQRVAATIEYFNRKSKDLLYTQPMALSTGYSGFDANIGALKNTGIELNLQTVPVRNEQFRWNLDLNLSHYKNTITELPTDPIDNGNKRLKVGGSIYDFFLREWAGVDPATGDPLWYKADANGDRTNETTNVYADGGQFILGSALPDLVGGFSNTFIYKQFDLSALLSFSLGGKVLDNDYVPLLHTGNSPGRAWSTEMLNRWTPENTQTDVPRLTTNPASTWTQASSRFLYSASYARLKNVSLGYTFPKQVLGRIGIEQLRIFLQGENLLTFYKHKGMDPEQTVNGATYYRYPAMRAVSAGIQLTL